MDETGAQRRRSDAGKVIVAGTASYQDTLWRIVGEPTFGPGGRAHWHGEAVLEPEPENRYDPNAVAVTVAGETVGYLPRDLAAQVQPALAARVARGERVTVPAYARGGFTFPDGTRASVGLGLRFNPQDLIAAAGEAARRAA